ncbi:hypothetical protein ACFDTO_22425 [Microbacteriaceae bacterium 4G12]
MQKKISIKGVEKEEHALIFCAEDTDIIVQELQSKQHVLVDSDNLAFLYIMENNIEFVYISIPHLVWPELKEALDTNKKVFIKVNGLQLELEQLKEEVEYLVANIEGNANYGDELVSKVESIFLS